MDTDLYFVGQQLPNFIGKSDVTQFDMGNSSSILTIVLENPSNEEVWNISKLNEIRMTCFADALWLTFQFGDLPWMDAPFNPHLSTRADLLQNLYRACSVLSIMLINSTDGRILYLGSCKFSDEFSAGLRVGTALLLSNEFHRKEYDAFCGYILQTYQPEMIADNSVVEFQLDKAPEMRE